MMHRPWTALDVATLLLVLVGVALLVSVESWFAILLGAMALIVSAFAYSATKQGRLGNLVRSWQGMGVVRLICFAAAAAFGLFVVIRVLFNL